MSLSGAMGSAVSALYAQSKALSIISTNLSNSSTIGYKTVNASFSELVTQSQYNTGGVVVSSIQNVSLQGNLTESSTSTSLAISGSGFFPVTYGVDGDETFFTRDGEFSINEDGYLVNGEYYLKGWATDVDGNVTTANTNSVDSLQAIDLNRYSSSASATTEVALDANLPADGEIGENFTSSLDVYDALGDDQSIPLTWTKTAANSWTVEIGDPTDPSTGETTGTIGGNSTYTITFDGDGTLASITDSSGNSVSDLTLTVSNWNNGADASSISLDIGTVGDQDGLTQFASGSTAPDIEVDNVSQNGVEYGSLSGVEINSDGTVIASYSNGQDLAIYKIPLTTFTNADGLKLDSYGVYEQTAESGTYSLQQAGTQGAGTINSYYLEASTTDTATEFAKMIQAQQAYSAASQVVTTCKDMYDTLLRSVG